MTMMKTTPEGSPGVVLSVRGLCLSYPDKPGVLRDMDLTVATGDRVGLIGPNGSGKTTLFMGICGVLKPDTGEVTVLGRPVIDGGFRPDVGLVFQNPDDQLFCPSVREDVAFGPRNMRLPEAEVEARVHEALTAVGALGLADRPAHHLSGGEKRMVAVASVLAMRPRLVLYDEPSASLDIRSRRQLIRLLQASPETMLIASHDLELILEICERVVLLDGGRIVTEGDPRRIMGDAALMEAHGQEKPHSLIPHQTPHHPVH